MTKYVELLELYLEEAKIIDIVLDLEAHAMTPLTKEDAILFESLDDIITKCMKRA